MTSLFTHSYAKIARTLLLIVTLLTIPFLIITTVFERAGGGTQRMKYLLFPFLCIVTYSAFTLYKRSSDKAKGLRSASFWIISETLVGLIALTLGCFTMYAMFTWNFELEIFMLLVGLIFISAVIILDDYQDYVKTWQNSNKY